VAALLELARFLKTVEPAQGLGGASVFYVNRGAALVRHRQDGQQRAFEGPGCEGKEVVAMLSLETMGWYSENYDIQRYPFPSSLFLSVEGQLHRLVANLRSRGLMHRVIGAFRRRAAFPSEGVAAPESIRGSAGPTSGVLAVRLACADGDHTAPFRYPQLPHLRDTPDKVSYDRLARVVKGLEGVRATWPRQAPSGVRCGPTIVHEALPAFGFCASGFRIFCASRSRSTDCAPARDWRSVSPPGPLSLSGRFLPWHQGFAMTLC